MIINSYKYAGGAAPSLLLDTYTGAAVAYSLRKLRTAYNGSAIRVRESSGNTEADIGFDGSGNLNTTALLSHCGANDGFVTKWYDQSGNGYDASQTTAASQPQIVSSGSVITENIQPAIDMNASKSTNRYLSTNQVSPSLAQPLSYFITTQVDAITNNAIIDGFTNGNGLIYRLLANQMRYFFGSTLTDASFPDTQQLITVLANTTSSEIYNNAILQLSGNLGSNNFDGLFIGNLGSNLQTSGFQLVGTMQEIIIYGSDQSSNRTGIETNINNHYGIY